MTHLQPSGNQNPFDALRREDERGEYWSARDLMAPLGYEKWNRFSDAIERAKVSCSNSGHDAESAFVHVAPLPGAGNLGANGQFQSGFGGNYRLSRYAAYLIAMNGDPRKPEIAGAQSYFAARTREAEVTESERRALPQTFAEALQLAADSQREIERQAAQLAIAAPKVEAYEAHVDSDGGITIRALAKQLADDHYQVTCKGMYGLLHTIGLIYRQGDTWVPYETARRDGLATSRMDVCADGRTREVALVTPAGVLEVRRRLSHLRAADSGLAAR